MPYKEIKMKYKVFFTAILFFTISTYNTFAASKPRLVVNIVVSSMGAGDIDRYSNNFGEDGFLRLVNGGAVYTNSRYDYQQTTTPVSLTTLMTGAMPSTHGVISTHWCDYVQNEIKSLIGAKNNYSPAKLLAPTLSDALLSQSANSQAITIATDPVSAIVAAGGAGEVYWLNEEHCLWATSVYYQAELPAWIAERNKERINTSYIYEGWSNFLPAAKYLNRRIGDIKLSNASGDKDVVYQTITGVAHESDYAKLIHTPAGNTAIFDLAKGVIAQNKLGADTNADILTISLDPARYITEVYGPESIEVEDMYYRLDRDLGDFLTFLYAQVSEKDVLVVLTSDHGSSPSIDIKNSNLEPFNTRQFEIIVNSFLNVRYGVGQWVIKYKDRCIYLNHNLIYEKKLNLEEVQNETATFVMQFDGISHALSSTSMRHSYFGSGYARKMQNSFYPRRSGDVLINFIPGLIELRDNCRSTSGSMYGYDSRVPLIFYGCGIAPQRIATVTDMTSVAPTVARMLNINEPIASEGTVLEELVGM